MRTIFNRIRSVSLGKAALALLLALVLILSLLPVSTLAEETDEARWVVQSGTDTPDTFTDSGTLDEAMDAANYADSNMYTYIQLCRDVTVSGDDFSLFYLHSNQRAVLDLGGYTLSAVNNNNARTVTNYGTLLVRNGTVSASGSTAIAIYSDGETILESGTFTATRTKGTYPYYEGFGVCHRGGEIYLGDVTKIDFDGYIDGMTDKNGQPIGRVNYGIDGGETYRFGGKEVITVEER